MKKLLSKWRKPIETTAELYARYSDLLLQDVKKSRIEEFYRHDASLTHAFIERYLNWRLASNFLKHDAAWSQFISILNASEEKNQLLNQLLLPGDSFTLSESDTLTFLTFNARLYTDEAISDYTFACMRHHALHRQIQALVKANYLKSREFFNLYTHSEKFYYLFRVGRIDTSRVSNLFNRDFSSSMLEEIPWAVMDFNAARANLITRHTEHALFLITNYDRLLDKDIFHAGNNTTYYAQTITKGIQTHFPPKKLLSLEELQNLFQFYSKVIVWTLHKKSKLNTVIFSKEKQLISSPYIIPSNFNFISECFFDEHFKQFNNLFIQYFKKAYLRHGDHLAGNLPYISVILLYISFTSLTLKKSSSDKMEACQLLKNLENTLDYLPFTLDSTTTKELLTYIHTSSSLGDKQKLTPLFFKIVTTLLNNEKYAKLNQLTEHMEMIGMYRCEVRINTVVDTLMKSLGLDNDCKKISIERLVNIIVSDYLQRKIDKITYEDDIKVFSNLIKHTERYDNDRTSFLKAILNIKTDPTYAFVLLYNIDQNGEDTLLNDRINYHLAHLIYINQLHIQCDETGKIKSVSIPKTRVDLIEQAILAYEFSSTLDRKKEENRHLLCHIINTLNKATNIIGTYEIPLFKMPPDVQQRFFNYYLHRFNVRRSVNVENAIRGIMHCFPEEIVLTLDELQKIFEIYTSSIKWFASQKRTNAYCMRYDGRGKQPYYKCKQFSPPLMKLFMDLNHFFAKHLIHAYQLYEGDIRKLLSPIPSILLKFTLVHSTEQEHKQSREVRKLLKDVSRTFHLEMTIDEIKKLFIYIRDCDLTARKIGTHFFIQDIHYTLLSNEKYDVLYDVSQYIYKQLTVDALYNDNNLTALDASYLYKTYIDTLYNDCIAQHIRRKIDSAYISIARYSELFTFVDPWMIKNCLTAGLAMHTDPVQAAYLFYQVIIAKQDNASIDLANYYLATLILENKISINQDGYGNIFFTASTNKANDTQAWDALSFACQLDKTKHRNKFLLSRITWQLKDPYQATSSPGITFFASRNTEEATPSAPIEKQNTPALTT